MSTKTPRPLRLSDIIEARVAESRASEAAARTSREQEERIASILQANPQIGILQGEAGRRFYVTSPVYREATDPATLVEG